MVPDIRDWLDRQIKSLEAQKASFIANVNACEGALVLARQLQKDLDSDVEEPEKPSDADTGAAKDAAPMAGEDHAAN